MMIPEGTIEIDRLTQTISSIRCHEGLMLAPILTCVKNYYCMYADMVCGKIPTHPPALKRSSRYHSAESALGLGFSGISEIDGGNTATEGARGLNKAPTPVNTKKQVFQSFPARKAGTRNIARSRALYKGFS